MTAPRPVAKRWQVVIRLAEDGLAVIDEYAKAEQRTRSSMIRVLLSEAIEARRKRGARTR